MVINHGGQNLQGEQPEVYNRGDLQSVKLNGETTRGL